jgi:membrane protease YdiL (CAAX protease family)
MRTDEFSFLVEPIKNGGGKNFWDSLWMGGLGFLLIWGSLLCLSPFFGKRKVRVPEPWPPLPLRPRIYMGILVLCTSFPIFFRSIVVQWMGQKNGANPVGQTVVSGTAGSLGLVLLLLVLSYLFPPLLSDLNGRDFKKIWSETLTVYARSLPTAFALSLLWQCFLHLPAFWDRPIQIDRQLFVRLLSEETIPLPWLFHMGLFVCFVGPLAEEIVFRGFLLRFLLEYRTSGQAIVLSAFIFSILHGHLPSFLPLLGLGILWGRLYVESRSLVACSAAHSLFNLTLFLLTLKTHSFPQ